MPGFTCCVPGCYSNSHRDKGLHFYTFPKDPELRCLWLKNVSRGGVSGCFSTFQPTNGHRVCSLHFQGGRKSYSIKVPTIFPLRGVNEKRTRRSSTKKRQQANYTPAATTVLVTGLPGQEEQEVLELTAGGAEMMLLGTAGGMGATIAHVEGSSAVMGATIDAMGTAAAGEGGSVAIPSNLLGETHSVNTHFSTDASHGSHQQLQVVVVGDEPFPSADCWPSSLFSDHSYSMSSGTTTEELLRKLNEQRDIIALMEVKMKEMKSSIKHLKVTEVKLREELRQKDKDKISPMIKSN